MSARFSNKRYTESDVLALYIKYRERNFGPFIREVGDFIAHSKRNRGVTLERTVYSVSQIAFFIKYQGNRKLRLEFFGDCSWWLKPWFLGKINDEPLSIIKRISGLNKLELIREINNWFDKKALYPRSINCNNPKLFYDLAQHFSKTIRGRDVFHISKVRKEVALMLRSEGIPLTETEPIIVATSVLLQGRSVEIIPGFTATIDLTIEPKSAELKSRSQLDFDMLHLINDNNPDGILKITVYTNDNTGDRISPISINFLDTRIESEEYFCRSFLRVDKHGIPWLDVSGGLAFERDAQSMVFPA